MFTPLNPLQVLFLNKRDSARAPWLVLLLDDQELKHDLALLTHAVQLGVDTLLLRSDISLNKIVSLNSYVN